jgi:hypothetical protein
MTAYRSLRALFDPARPTDALAVLLQKVAVHFSTARHLCIWGRAG